MKKIIIAMLVLVVALLSIYPIKTLFVFIKTPAYPEYVPSDSFTEVPEVYSIICDALQGKKGLYRMNFDKARTILLNKVNESNITDKDAIDIIGDKSELFVEEKLVIPDFVRVTDKSIIFYCSPDLINYMLIHSDSAINIVSDLKSMNVLNNYHLMKRIDQGWYFIYY